MKMPNLVKIAQLLLLYYVAVQYAIQLLQLNNIMMLPNYLLINPSHYQPYTLTHLDSYFVAPFLMQTPEFFFWKLQRDETYSQTTDWHSPLRLTDTRLLIKCFWKKG